jgi:hypothetical protein
MGCLGEGCTHTLLLHQDLFADSHLFVEAITHFDWFLIESRVVKQGEPVYDSLMLFCGDCAVKRLPLEAAARLQKKRRLRRQAMS